MDIDVRRPGPADAAALFGLVSACDIDEVGYVDYELADAVEELSRPNLDLDSDAWLAVRDGRVVGYAAAAIRSGTAEVDGEVYVHPTAPDELYVDLLRRLRRRAAEQAAGDAVLSTYAPATEASRSAARLRADGWRPVRRFARMSIDLDGTTPPPPLPPGVTLAHGFDADEVAVHAVIMDSFADHFGHTPEPFEEWHARQLTKAGHDRELWSLATVDGEPAAALIGRHMTEQGWVAALGVRSGFRGRGLARLLLRTSFTDFARRGYARVALGVDTANVTGALRLYESVGMAQSEAYDYYQVRVPALRS